MHGKPYGPDFFAMKPTATTRYFRVFWPWQFIRFLVINMRMVSMILKSHHTEVK